jgi:carbon-monoxide dehydrogenase large subunit
MSGAAQYVADIKAPGSVELAFVRSYLSHGTIESIDSDEARTSPGVVGVYAASDLPDLPLVPPSVGNEKATEGRERPALASSVVRFVGEPIVAVAADDRYFAEDAVEKIWVDLEPLDPVVDPIAAMSDDSPQLFSSTPNLALTVELGTDVESILAAAPMVVDRSYVNRRLAHTPMEARAILVIPEEEGVTVWCSHQAPHRLRDALGAAFGDRVPDGFRIRVPEVGGAFGQKTHTYPEYIVATELALLLQRPVRWVEDRRESFIAAAHGRGQTQRIRVAADRDGNLLAAAIEIVGDLGAYPHTGSYVPLFSGTVLSGPYKFPAMSARIRGVVTNKAPTAPYRGAGRPEAAFLLERTMDELATSLGIDPAELRFRNFVAPADFPYQTPMGATYDSGDYAETLRRALALIDYDEARAEQAKRRSTGGTPLGIGICSFVERSGGPNPSPEYGAVEVGWDGRITCRSGSASTGQGHETAFPELVASVLGVDASLVNLVQKDTAEVPQGFGTFASRSMQVGGSALHQASRGLIATALEKAAELLGRDQAELRYENGVVLDADGELFTLQQVAEKTGSLECEVTFMSPHAFPSGTYAAVVEVDTDTGQVSIVRLAAVDDAGTIINPTLVHGQVRGSVAQGVGQALYEEFVYDDEGQPLTTTLMDYPIPTAAELPELRLGWIETPNPDSPIGAKGAGEAGSIGVPPAVVNAIVDALRPLGVDDIEMPATPLRVRTALKAAESSTG